MGTNPVDPRKRELEIFFSDDAAIEAVKTIAEAFDDADKKRNCKICHGRGTGGTVSGPSWQGMGELAPKIICPCCLKQIIRYAQAVVGDDKNTRLAQILRYLCVQGWLFNVSAVERLFPGKTVTDTEKSN